MSASATYRMLRTTAGLTTDDAAALLNVSTRTYQRWESAPADPATDAPKDDVLDRLRSAAWQVNSYADEMIDMIIGLTGDQFGRDSVAVFPRFGSDEYQRIAVDLVRPSWLGAHEAAVAIAINALVDETDGNVTLDQFHSVWRGGVVRVSDGAGHHVSEMLGATVLGAAELRDAWTPLMPLVALLEEDPGIERTDLPPLSDNERAAMELDEVLEEWDSGNLRDL